MQEKGQTNYYPPEVRRAMMNANVLLSPEELALAEQVEKTLASSGIIVPGSMFDVPKKSNLLNKALVAILR